VVSDVLRRSNVVLSTCVGAGSKLLQREEFDLVVIDEAAQGLEAACWIPILKMKEAGGRCVLAGTTIADDTALHSIIQVVNPWGSPLGDHCQLPPTIKSAQAEKGGLSVTLFERIIKDARFSNVVCLLDTQYRMNRRISDWASHNMYHDAIQSHPSVAEHTLGDILPGGRGTLSASAAATDEGTDSTETSTKDSAVATAAGETGPEVSDQREAAEEQYPVLLLVDTSGLGMFEDSSLENTGGDAGGKKLGASHRNFHEAELVKQHVLSLVRSGAQIETSRRNYLSHSVIPFLQSVRNIHCAVPIYTPLLLE
jgi:superfamily I DNA and/or RNA helicase